MSVCVDANITGTFRNFFEVHYTLLQRYRILQNVNASGLLSGVGIFSGLLSGGLLSVHQHSNMHVGVNHEERVKM